MEKNRNKELKKELRRKSLSRNSSIIGAKKKRKCDLGGARGKMISALDHMLAVELINEARANGSRLKPAYD